MLSERFVRGVYADTYWFVTAHRHLGWRPTDGLIIEEERGVLGYRQKDRR